MAGEIRIERDGAIAVVTLAHAGRLNAMSRAMWRALRTAFLDFEVEAGLRCIVVRGEGGAFCAGGDISEYPSFRFDPVRLRSFHEDEVGAALQAMRDGSVPVVAQIEGACMGAGLEIASCCDIRLAGASARFGAPIAKLGFPMAPREAAVVHRAVGDVLARDMLLAAGVHDAQRLLDTGFLLRVVSDDAVADEAIAYARRIAALAPEAARANKRVLAALTSQAMAGVAGLLPAAYDYADSPEHREGIAAFLAKRPPHF
ncbi:enoyl-CoA hydratase/isomerase family protein [Variovorax arabinosiphilus]|uniref:enoyl-CoA hydratase/isomerase family protein n=1 Tax=Variovorax arabinosiphilus TaxID=3053498 RepID=UPI0025764B3F|nr:MULTISPECIES: enoyl-CoA hydratase/isomerase family protein [unclassified Variovorax]MDM0119250.1 enoyl-CoA hydratase/isomerase family protein [Variovorax sp. J2L1-78]MDM0129676.1 enoyl-CoA hydratase/isomerase family protein [Variovorax sp. J2L1-63]MDM0232538.1 enoyl-CoA hydratase/isomerase family protein [Variovorax sp. J2R1-6]